MVTDQDLLDRMDKYHAETVDFANKFAKSTSTLKAALKLAEDSKKKLWVEYKPLITIVVIIITLTACTYGMSFAMKANDMCFVTLSQKEPGFTVKSCKEKTP